MRARAVAVMVLLAGGCGAPLAADAEDTGADGSATTADAESTGSIVDCPVASDLGPGDHTLLSSYDGVSRSVLVHVPAKYDSAVATPLVLNMHGFTSNPTQQITFSGMNPVADAEGFVVAYPTGTNSSWNAGTCCGLAASNDVDDVGFLREVVAELSTRLCVDPARVYATGMSNGGYMSHRLGCEASDLFAAVAPVAGAMGIATCEPGRAMPVVAYNGTEDNLVSYEDGREAMLQWVATNACDGEPSDVTMHGGSRCERWTGCRDDVEVELCTLEGMGHCWPGGSELLCLDFVGPYSDEIDANSHMWSFLSRFRL
jgi:polyhydroxybutyrate depolymerase